ncbi:lipopolysaccharide biosynthesis protein [Planotetraspora silvatica]|uniref:Lipopolysaccharide biosynthesis protein n=1 Tax=Planotetraspora silvatica TaxID=234614 RepID=A0A8J3UHC4_9ACTN|nr:lipopolysaccharide biosynthesis protein [Planotetraspora silvatica]GII45688.1 lipopolysaccharide biosynthesis protein [Planotetraspora silvatica]
MGQGSNTETTLPVEKKAAAGHATTAESAAHGARWTVAAMIARQFGRLGFAVVLARMLGPVDFAIVGAATIYITLTAVLLETGIATGIVQKEDLRKADEGTAFWTVTGIGALVSVLTVVLAMPISNFLGIPALQPVLTVLAVGPLLKGLIIVSAARLQRDLRFRALGLGEIVATLVGGALGVAAAELGAQYWALVWQQVATDLLCLIIWAAAAGLPGLVMDREAFRHVRKFGVPLMGSQMFGYVSRNADTIIVSHYLGQAALSFYMIPYRIMLVPVSLLGNVANRVAFPIIARIQDQPQQVRRIYLKITQVIAVAVVPGMLAVAVLSPQVVETVFGPEWMPAVPVLIALTTTGILESLTTTGGSVFMGTGRADLALRWSWIPLLVCLPAFFLGLPWGATGVAAAYSVAVLVITPFQVHAIGKLAAFSLLDWGRAILPTVLASVPAVGAGYLLTLWFEGFGIPVPAVAVIGLLVIAVLYMAFLRIVAVELFRDSLTTARLLVRGKLGAETEEV